MIPVLEDIIRGLLAGTMTHEAAAHYLKLHEEMQNQVDCLERVSYERAQVVMDTLTRCDAQDKRWGPRQYPSFHPALTSSADTTIAGLASTHRVMTGEAARWVTQVRDSELALSWMDILVEEVCKLTEKYEDREALRDQLLDVGAVAIQWATQLTPEEKHPCVEDDEQETFGALAVDIIVGRRDEDADHEGPGSDSDG